MNDEGRGEVLKGVADQGFNLAGGYTVVAQSCHTMANPGSFCSVRCEQRLPAAGELFGSASIQQQQQ